VQGEKILSQDVETGLDVAGKLEGVDRVVVDQVFVGPLLFGMS
jgi:hypothetical protein